MKNNKWYVISTFVLGCIVINFAGRILSDRLQLPLWLDSFGTSDKSCFTDYSCKDFITVLSGKAPVPGGGGASAFFAISSGVLFGMP